MSFVNGGVTAPSGFKGAGIHCGIKKRKKDLALIYSEVPAIAAGVFTANKIPAAPVRYNREKINKNSFRAVVINSGNANACTGQKGLEDTRDMAKFTAAGLGIEEKEVLVASTGLIGQRLPMERIRAGVENLVSRLSDEGRPTVAEAIMTTDKSPKEIAWQFSVDGRIVKIGAVAKGAGMIFPNMATMLCFITTDVNIDKALLRKALLEAVEQSFNSITVDGDQSTNDMVIILANGLAGNSKIAREDKDFLKFKEGLGQVTQFLAQKIIEDAEGATKFIEILVKGAGNTQEAEKAAQSIANSLLVKTSLYGADPNWGRIMASLGSAGIKLKEEKIDIAYGDYPVVKNGKALNFSVNALHQKLKERKIKILVNLGMGKGEKRILTVDLSPEYIKINAGYFYQRA